MKKIIHIIIILSLGGISCTKEFLSIDDNSKLFRQNYIKDVNTLASYSNGILLEFASIFEFGSGSGYAEIISDNLKPAGIGIGLYPHYNWQQQVDPTDNQTNFGANPEAKSSNPLWKSGYRLIRNCNYVIEVASKYAKEDPSLAEKLTGQTLALRAYLHFRLIQIFAQNFTFTDNANHPGIPYITSSNATELFPRLSVHEVYSKIIKDCETALPLLTSKYQDSRVFTQESVKAILSRVYLYKEDYAKAKSYAIEVSTNHPLMQISQGYPDRIFMYEPQKQDRESILQLSPQGGNYPTATIFLGVFLKTEITWTATSDIVEILSENPLDVRSSWIKKDGDKWIVTKFPENAAPNVTPAPSLETGAYYVPLIRSSELYLTIAECSAKSGNETMAQEYLNAIRLRANPAASAIAPTGRDLLDSIYKERRKELSFEGLRMSDLQRWKLGVHRLDALPGSPKDLSYPNEKAIAPIPPGDVKLGGIPQNPGY